MKLNKHKMVSLIGAIFGIVFAIYPHQLTVSATLAEPVGYEYKYKAVDIAESYVWFMQKTGGGSYSPTYTRIADSGYYKYTTTISDSNYSPFPITLTFNRSTTSWLNSFENEWVPNDTAYIGGNNTVGDAEKIKIDLNNNTTHDYNLYIDISSTYADHIFVQNIDGIISRPYIYYYSFGATFYIPANATVSIYRITSGNLYMDAFYLDDLGVSSAYTEGYDDGEYEGYNSGYGVGYDEGSIEGYSEGQSDFFYGEYGAFEGLETDSVPYTTGYNVALNYYETAFENQTGLWSLLSGAFTVPLSVLSIEILPNITLLGIAMIPIVFGVIFLIWKWIK